MSMLRFQCSPLFCTFVTFGGNGFDNQNDNNVNKSTFEHRHIIIIANT